MGQCNDHRTAHIRSNPLLLADDGGFGMNFDNNAVCDICGKPRMTLGRLGRQEHPACSRKRQQMYAEKKRNKPKPVLTQQGIEYLTREIGSK